MSLKPEVFSTGLKRLMVSAALVIEKMILQNLYRKLGLKFEEKEGYEFSGYVEELSRNAVLKHEVEERKLRAIFASSPDAIIISDLQGNIVSYNEATLKLEGFSSKEELVGKSGFEFVAEKDRKRVMESLKRTLE